MEESSESMVDEVPAMELKTETVPEEKSRSQRVDPKDLDFILLDENVKHPSAPPMKKRGYVKERCECKRRGYDCGDHRCVNRAMRQECSASTCSLHKDECKNRCLQKKAWRNVEIREAGEKGHGLFAAEDIEEDAFVLEYYGELIGTSEFTRRTKESGHRYFMALEDGLFLDPSRRGSIARFMNHSCDPNSLMEIWTVRGELRACVYTSKKILKDQELTFDYGWEPMAKKPLTKCRCGTAKCRNFIEDWESFDQDAAAHRVGTWEIPTGSHLGLHKSLSSFGTTPAKPTPTGADLVERRVRVWWDGNEAWFDADIISYDETKKLHLLQYCTDGEQGYEDLAGYVERGPLTDSENHNSPTTASGEAYYGLMYTNPEDLRYIDKETNSEVSCSIWELLNEGDDSSDSGTNTTASLPVVPIQKKKHTMRRKSDVTTLTPTDVVTSSASAAVAKVIQRKNNQQRMRAGGVRRSDSSNATIGSNALVKHSTSSAFPPAAPYPGNAPWADSSIPFPPSCSSPSSLPFPPSQPPRPSLTSDVLAASPWHQPYSSSFNYQQRDGFDSNSISQSSNSLLPSHYKHHNYMKEDVRMEPSMPKAEIVVESCKIDLAGMDSRTNAFVGTIVLKNVGKKGVVFKVKLNDNVYAVASQKWLNSLSTESSSSKSSHQSVIEDKDVSSNAIQDEDIYIPKAKIPSLPNKAPLLAPDFGTLPAGGSVEVRVNIYKEPVNQLRAYTLFHCKSLPSHQPVPKYTPKTPAVFELALPCFVDAICCDEEEENAIFREGPLKAKKVFYELSSGLNLEDEVEDAKLDNTTKTSTISHQRHMRVVSFCNVMIDTEALIEKEVKKEEEERLKRNQEAAAAKAQAMKEAARRELSNSKKRRREKASSSGSEKSLKHIGDLSSDEIRAGWRMKISSSRNGKPYYFRPADGKDGELLWSRSEVRARTIEWVSKNPLPRRSSQSEADFDSSIPPPPP